MGSLGHVVNREEEYKPFNLNIVGFRNRLGRTNHFDDVIGIYFERDKAWQSFFCAATTRPGLPSLLKPVHERGTAILVPGQYKNAYSIGLHKGKYEALVQIGVVEVYRDNNKDTVYDMDNRTVHRGLFGINIHRASFGAKLVGPDSAGCQVIRDGADFSQFMEICDQSASYRDSKFTYTLVEL